LTRLLCFPCLLPLLLSCASLSASFGSLSSAWPRINLRDPLNAAAPAQPATKFLLLLNFASPAHTGDEFSDFPRILRPAARAAKRISDFYRTFHLPAWQEIEGLSLVPRSILRCHPGVMVSLAFSLYPEPHGFRFGVRAFPAVPIRVSCETQISLRFLPGSLRPAYRSA
jgi:hypothetical protein